MNTETNSSFVQDGAVLRVTGILDGNGADSLVTAMSADIVYTLDFDEVEEIKFSALRVLLRCRRSGRHFFIVNASVPVAERFEDTGVSNFVNVCRKPKPLRLDRYEEFGAGFLSTALYSDDGDSMIKVYGPRVPRGVVAQEKTIARAVMVFGIPTPMVGTLYEDGDKMALDFERIQGKHSFSRIISQEPDRLEEMSVRFARMCRHLHSTPCDTNIFSDRSHFYREAVIHCKDLSEAEREKILSFIDNVPSATTCLHGDMQPSNVITSGHEDLWIDLSDFGYGNPMFDLGMWYFLANLTPEERMQHIFHFGKDLMPKVWEVFLREYFDADTPEKRAAADKSIQPFAALHMVYLGSLYGFEDSSMLEYIRKVLL